MREKVRDKARLEHIIEAIDTVFEFTDCASLNDLCKNKMMFFAVVKNIEIIGEAAYMLSLEFKEKHSEVEWQPIIAMRHFLVHGYYKVDATEVFNVIKNDLQPLKEQIVALKNEIE